MVRSVIAAVLLALFVLPGAALADWRWTTWDMPAKTVIAGSDGEVAAIKGRDGQSVHGWSLLATGRLRFEDFPVQAEFFFDADGKALKLVRLSLIDPNQCEALTTRLTAMHGEGEETRRSFGSLQTLVVTWPHTANGDFAALTSVSAVGDLAPVCFVRYRPAEFVNGPLE